MEDAFALLKKEINQTMDAEHDLAKWKLIVIAALGGTAFGLSGSGSHEKDWMLLLIPYVCAYVDLYAYQYQIRIQVLSRFLTQPQGDSFLKQYEADCEVLRERGVFSLGSWAGVGSSIVASLTGPLVYVKSGQPGPVAVWAWIFGILLIVLLYGFFRWKLYIAKHESLPSGAESPPRERRA
jgi:hypothetical protein